MPFNSINKKGSQFDLLQLKEKEKLNLNNNKTINIEENNEEKILHNSNSNNNIYNYKDIDYQNMIKFKLSENTSSRLNINNKGSIIKKFNNIKEEINIYNFGDYNLKKINNKRSAKNKAYIGLPKKQSKLLLFDHNKNFGPFNNNAKINNINNEIKINLKNKNDLAEIKEIFFNKIHNDGKENIFHRNFSNISGNKKKIKSVEMQHKQGKFNKKDISEENIYYNNQRNLTNKNYINANENSAMKEYLNRSNEDVHYKISQNNEVNQNDINSTSLISIDKNENSRNIKKIINNINYINNRSKELRIKTLTKREKVYYILAKNNILNLREKIIFSQANKNISSLISIKDILKQNEIFIKDKIQELEEKITDYNQIIETHFTPSKTAIISLNIIKKEDENNFKNFLVNNNSLEEKEKNIYLKYIELLFILIQNNINDKNFGKLDINTLYNELNKKGFKSCKDFLYDNFISQKTLNAYEAPKMNKFSEIFCELPDFIKNQGEIKNNRFISFSYFLLNEMYIYWNKLKEIISLKDKAQNYIECLKNKISIISKSYK